MKLCTSDNHYTTAPERNDLLIWQHFEISSKRLFKSLWRFGKLGNSDFPCRHNRRFWWYLSSLVHFSKSIISKLTLHCVYFSSSSQMYFARLVSFACPRFLPLFETSFYINYHALSGLTFDINNRYW